METLESDWEHDEDDVIGSFDVLHDEDLLHIFSFLTFQDLFQAEQVCFRWSEIVDESLKSRRKLSLNDLSTSITEALEIIQRCGSAVRHLDLCSNRSAVDDAFIKLIATSCPNLISLSFNCKSVTADGFKCLAENCIKLNEIKFKLGLRMTDDGLAHLIKSLPLLKHLHLNSFGKRFQESCLNNLRSDMETLTWTHRKWDYPIIIKDFVLNLKHLTELRLKGDILLSPSKFEVFCKESDRLKILEISDTQWAVDTMAVIFGHISHLKSLEELNLSKNLSLFDASLWAISRGCRNLRILKISSSEGVSDLSLKSIAENCRLLTDLNISRLQNVTDESLSAFAKVGKLRRFTAQYCHSIADVGIVDLLTDCHELQLMDITGCKCVTSSVLQHCLRALRKRNNALRLKFRAGCLKLDDGSGIRADDALDFCHPLLVAEIIRGPAERLSMNPITVLEELMRRQHRV